MKGLSVGIQRSLDVINAFYSLQVITVIIKISTALESYTVCGACPGKMPT